MVLAMERSSLPISILVIAITISSYLGTCAGDPRTTVAAQVCDNTTSVSAATLANNFVIAMGNLSNLVGQQGFGTVVVGRGGPSAVYGLAQCFEDLNSIDCKLCFSEIRSQLPKCYPNSGGRIFLDGCFGRYANYSFFDDILDADNRTVCSSNKTNTDGGSFVEVVRRVVGNVSLQAPQTNGYAVGSASGSGFTVYALSQCWQNIDQAVCNTCLRSAAASVTSCAPSTEGRSLNAGCYVRYSTSLFWNQYPVASISSGNHHTVWILVGSLSGIFLIMIGLLFLWKHLHRKSNMKSLEALYGPQLSAAIAKTKLNFRYEELKRATNNFSLENKLGQGSYGTVYKAILYDGKEVAVKRLFLNTRQWIDQFFNEVTLVHKVRHKNLVKLLGCSVDGSESLLVYEYYSNGSLDHYVFGHEKHLNWKQRYDIIQGIAEGLSYLHEESETRIIHRDIKASNILLDEKFKAKITDFGLARSFSEGQTHICTGIAGTPGYMAPEYIIHGHLTEKADVYSFGMLTLEIVTGKRCSATIGSKDGHILLQQIWNHYKANAIERIANESIYDHNIRDEIRHVVKIGVLCTQGNPQHRPTMGKVVELLRSTRSGEELILADPPFLDDVTLENMEERNASCLLSTISHADQSLCQPVNT